MGISADIKAYRLKLCKMLDGCLECSYALESKLVPLDYCKACSHWKIMQEVRFELEELQKTYRLQRSGLIEQKDAI